MNWEIVASAAEVVSAVAVVISLIYLAVQIRHNTLSTNASAHHQYLVTQSSANHSITDNADVCELIDKANKDFGSLTDPEIIRLQFVMYEQFNQWQFAFSTGQKLLLERELWDTYTRGYTQTVSALPALQKMWEICGPAYDPKFRAHVDAAIATGEAPVNREN